MNKKAPYSQAPFLLKILAFIFIILLSAGVFTLIGIVFSGASLSDLSTSSVSINKLIVIQIFSSIGTFIAPALIYAKLFENNPFSFFKLKKLPSLKLIIFTITILILANFVSDILVKIMHLIPFESFNNKFINNLLQAEIDGEKTINNFLKFSSLGKFFVVFFMMAILPGIGEELTFRGVFMNLFHQSSKNIILAIVFSALLFAIIHVQLHNFLAIFFMGTLLGTIYYLTKNLWVSIIAHFFNNGIIVLLTYLNNIGKISFDFSQKDNMPLNVSIFGALMFFITFYIYSKYVVKERKMINE